MKTQQLKKILWVTSAPITVRAFLRPILTGLRDEFEIHVVSNMTGFDATPDEFGIHRLHHVAIERDISPVKDLYALWHLVKLIRTERFDIVHSVTPKAGLLGMTAARLVGTPRRIHTFTGQVWATQTGVMRALLKSADRAIVAAATQVLADGRGQADFLISQRIVKLGGVNVLANGSISGVDLHRFRPLLGARGSARSTLHANSDDVIVLFLGRVHVDKGVIDLLEATNKAARRVPNLRLVVAGPDDSELEAIITEVAEPLGERFVRIGYVPDPENLLPLADIFVLPSRREGFGTSVLEAAACGVPSVVTDIYGLQDAVVPSQTALVVPVADVGALAEAIIELATDARKRIEMGNNALNRVQRLFSRDEMVTAYRSMYLID